MVKITSLNIISALSDSDYFPIVDVSGNVTAKISRADLFDMLQLPAESVNAQAIDDDAIEWKLLNRAKLDAPAVSLSVSFTPKKYLKVVVRQTTSGGTVSGRLRCNNDTGANYASRYDMDGAADVTEINANAGLLYGTTQTSSQFAVVEIYNIASTEKVALVRTVKNSTAGAGTAPTKMNAVTKLANTVAQISSLQLFNASGAGQYGAETEITVYGRD